MEDNLNELLELSSEPNTSTGNSNSSSSTSEKAIKIIAIIFLVVGIILAWIGFINFLLEMKDYRPDIGEIFGYLSLCFMGFICVVVWAILKALSNISTTLKEIKAKIK